MYQLLTWIFFLHVAVLGFVRARYREAQWWTTVDVSQHGFHTVLEYTSNCNVHFSLFFKHTDRHCIVSRVMNCLIGVCISLPFKEWSKVTEITSFHFYFYERCFIHTSPGRKMSKSPLRKHKWLLRTYYPVRSLSWYSSLWPSVWSLFLYLSNYFNK